MSQCTRLTDRRTNGQTDRILIARPHLHFLQRSKNYAFVMGERRSLLPTPLPLDPPLRMSNLAPFSRYRTLYFRAACNASAD